MISITEPAALSTEETPVVVRAARWRVLVRRPTSALAATGCLFIVLVGILGPLVTPFAPNAQSSSALLGPSAHHLFGTDEFGRDLFSRMLAGARVSITVGIGSILIGLAVGSALGIIAGSSTKALGTVIMRLMDVILSFPVLLLGAVMAGITLGRHLHIGPVHLGEVAIVTLVISIVQVPVFARIARASVLTQRDEEYMLAARACGASRRQLVVRHLIPNIQAPLVVQAAFGVGVDIVLEASLSFLGLGVQNPQASWGNIMAEGQQQILFGGWWLIVFPTAAIGLTALCFNVLGDGVRDTFDPRHMASTLGWRIWRTGRSNVKSVTTELDSVGAGDGSEPGDDLTGAAGPTLVSTAPHRDPGVPPDRQTALLRVEHLTVTYRNDHHDKSAVRDVSLSVGAGRSLGIVGESGSGKSTVLRAILGLLPTATVTGRVLFKGEDLLSLGSDRLRQTRGGSISAVFQDPVNALNPSIRVGRQLTRVLRLHRPDIPRTKRAEEASRLLSRVGVDPAKMRNFPFEFSQGQVQRIMIAAASLAARPDVILADEPTTSLDVTVEAQVLSLLSELRHELDLSLILVSHDLAVVSKMCDRVVVMYAGTVVEELESGDLLVGRHHPYTELLLGSIPAFPSDGRRLEPVPSTLRSEGAGPVGRCVFASRCPKHLGEVCDSVPVTLVGGATTGQQVRCHLFDGTTV